MKGLPQVGFSFLQGGYHLALLAQFTQFTGNFRQ
jgi:hypothetical protein